MRIIFSLAASGVVFYQLIELAVPDERPVDAPTYPLPAAYIPGYVHKSDGKQRVVRRAWECAR